MRSLTNSEDPDEMPHNPAFHHGLHCLIAMAKTIFRERNTFYVGIITSDPWVYKMEPPKFIASNQKKESIMKERVKPNPLLYQYYI